MLQSLMAHQLFYLYDAKNTMLLSPEILSLSDKLLIMKCVGTIDVVRPLQKWILSIELER